MSLCSQYKVTTKGLPEYIPSYLQALFAVHGKINNIVWKHHRFLNLFLMLIEILKTAFNNALTIDYRASGRLFIENIRVRYGRISAISVE